MVKDNIEFGISLFCNFFCHIVPYSVPLDLTCNRWRRPGSELSLFLSCLKPTTDKHGIQLS